MYKTVSAQTYNERLKTAYEKSNMKRKGRPPGSKTRPKVDEQLMKDLIETKLAVAELALKDLKNQLLTTKDPEERERLLAFLTDLVRKIVSA